MSISKSIKNFNSGKLKDLLIYDCAELNLFRKQKETCAWITENLKEIKQAAQKYKEKAEAYPKSYNQCRCGAHRGIYKDAIPEKEIARGLFNIYQGSRIGLVHEPLATTEIGCFEDYETPIFHTRKTGRGRNVDLISVKHAEPCEIFLHELKRNGSKETLLRCIMEAYTYSLLLNREKLKTSFGAPNNAKIVICPTFFIASKAYEDLQELQNERYKELENLIECITSADDEIRITFAVLDAIFLEKMMPQDINGGKFKRKWLAVEKT